MKNHWKFTNGAWVADWSDYIEVHGMAFCPMCKKESKIQPWENDNSPNGVMKATCECGAKLKIV